MKTRLPRRRAWLLLIALVIPCVVLLALGIRMISEGQEVAEARYAADRLGLVGRVGRELVSRLERIKIDEAGRLAASAEPDAALGRPRHESVAFTGWVRGGRLLLPWDVDPASARFAKAVTNTPFGRAIDEGLRYESTRQLMLAQQAFQHAQALAPDPVVRNWPEFLEARVLISCNCADQAHPTLTRLLDSVLVDDQGVPLAFWAVAQLGRIRDVDSAAAATAALDRLLASNPTISPFGWYQARDVLAALDAGEGTEAGRAVARMRGLVDEAIADVERALALQREWPNLAVSAAVSEEPLWVPFADGAWLVGVAPALAGRSPAAVVIRAEPTFTEVVGADPGLVGVAVTTDLTAGQPFGTALPGLGLVVPEADPAVLQDWALQRAYYVAALVAVIGLALFGAVLLWRDVQRELHVADLRSEFVASVSHELRTPLTAIRMFAETLQMDRPLDETARAEYLNTIVTESERLTRLVTNVLDFSKIERGEKVYRLEPASLPSIVQNAVRSMAYPLSRLGFELRVIVADSLPPVRVDRDAIEQALLNLLSNAVKYSGEARTIDLTVSALSGHAVIAVTDRGLGIPPDEQPHIFDRFYRARDNEASRVAGAGLGLAIVDHIVKAHGGRIEVTSARGMGSTFAIHIPGEAA
jgi:signal transduction histidine kinase